MKTLKRTAVGTVLSALLVAAGSAHAGVVIDDFLNPSSPLPQQLVTDSTVGGTPVANQFGPASGSSIIGGYRDLIVNKVSDTFAGGSTTLRAGDGFLSLDNSSGVTGWGIVQWDGGTDGGNPAVLVTNGLGGKDLTGGGAFDRFVATVLDIDLEFNYAITVYDMSGNWSTLASSVVFAVVPPASVDADYLFDWFKFSPGTHTVGGLTFQITRSGSVVDFANVGALQLFLEGTKVDVDLTLGKIQTVPEPTTLALIGLGLLGAGVVRRRARAD